ncbi:MAG TPA: cupin domain-containing protein [Acidimicrobiia bacterium]|nr:cupin domain-containing protein [Acidimicrobiia bacterium]
MTPISKETADRIERLPGLERRFGELDGFTVSFESYSADHDYAPLDKGLPGDRCPSPHWGVVLKGKLIYRYEDGEDVITARQAFYARPGHTAWLGAGTELIKFSPTDQLEGTFEVTRDNLAGLLD